MKSQSRLTLENASEGQLNATLQYTLSNGERLTMEFLLPKPGAGAPSQTVQQIEEAMLRRASEIARHMLGAQPGRAE